MDWVGLFGMRRRGKPVVLTGAPLLAQETSPGLLYLLPMWPSVVCRRGVGFGGKLKQMLTKLLSKCIFSMANVPFHRVISGPGIYTKVQCREGCVP